MTTLEFRVSGIIVDIQGSVDTHIVGLDESTRRVPHQSLTDNAVLDGDVMGIATTDGKHLVAPPCHRTVVEDDVVAVGNAQSIGTRRTYDAHSQSQIPTDGVVGTTKRQTIAIDGNSLTWCRLTRDIEIGTDADARVDTYHSRHIEDDDTPRLADGITKRPCPCVIEVSHMIDSPIAASCGKASETFGSGERQYLGSSGSHNGQQDERNDKTRKDMFHVYSSFRRLFL